MIIHIVQSDETINSIADKYGISTTRLIQENGIMNADNLVVGQTIVIVYPEQTYIVQEGDTLVSISKSNEVSVMQLLRNNPYLLDREVLYQGETLVVSYADEKIKDTTTNGYAYPYINRDVLRKNLLFLTYLSVFSYSVKSNGELNDIDDIEIIDLAKTFEVAPVMVISNVTQEGIVDKGIFHKVLNNEAIKNNLIENIYKVVTTKGYYGINIDTPYILEEDREMYFEFISTITERFNKEGFKVFITITPETFKSEVGKNEIVDYSRICHITNGVILLSYSWGYALDNSIELTPFYILEILLVYILRQISPEKTTIGFSNIGYVIEIPYEAGVTKASSISTTNVIQLASDVGAEIKFNEVNLLSYFYIMGVDNYVAYFHDIRAVETYTNMMTKYGLHGLGIWNVMYFLPQTFLFINTQYNILKVI